MTPLATSAHEAQIDPLFTDDYAQSVVRWRWLHSIASPVFAVIEFCKDVCSPGLNDVPPVSTLDIRNGGQYRY